MPIRCDEGLFKSLVEKHTTKVAILKDLGLPFNQGYYSRWVSKRVLELGLDISHWDGGKGFRRQPRKSLPLEELLVFGRPTESSDLKSRLIREKRMVDICGVCGLLPIWNGKPLTLHLDHIDGNHNNNLIGNLRILCPHCHQQTPTFGSKNRKKPPKQCGCGAMIRRPSEKCGVCTRIQMRGTRTKIQWPELETLVEMLKSDSVESVGRKLGVTGNRVKKHLQKRGCWVPRRKAP